MNKLYKKLFSFLFVSILFLVGGFSALVPKTNAAATITVSTAKITGPNQITIVFIPVNGNMLTAPATAFAGTTLALSSGGTRSITSLDSLTINTAVYTFNGAPVATNVTASLTVTTPTLITDTASANTFDATKSPILLTDGQAPTFIADRLALNVIRLTFSENVTGDSISGSFTVAGETAPTTNEAVGVGTFVTLTTTGLTDTAGTPEVNYVAAVGDIVDNSPAHNEVANGGVVLASDQVKPTVTTTVSQPHIVAADNGGTFNVIETFSEPMDTGVYPTISFSENVLGSGLLTFIAPTLGSWSDLNKIFTQQYTINGLISENFAGVDITVEGGQDYPAGNVMDTLNTFNVFDVDTVAPTADVTFALTTPAENGTTNHLTGGGATYYVNADVAKGTTSVVITGTKTVGQTIVVAGMGEPLPRDDSYNVVVTGTTIHPIYTVNTVTNGLSGSNGPGDNVSLTGGNKTFLLTVSEAGKSDIVYTVNVQVAVPTTIAAIAIAGVTPPVTGATPVTTVTAGTGYTGTVSWSGSPTTFASATTYTATITLTATSGYTLTGVTENQFTIAGSTSDTNPASSGVITAVFPATAVAATHSSSGGYIPRAINLLDLSGECKLGDLFSTVTGKLCSTSSISFIPSLQTPTLCMIYGSAQELVKEKTRGINAKGVQNAINQIKAITPPLVIDSIIGSLSEAGIINAQKILLVTPDGIWGPKTQQAYELFIKKQCTTL